MEIDDQDSNTKLCLATPIERSRFCTCFIEMCGVKAVDAIDLAVQLTKNIFKLI